MTFRIVNYGGGARGTWYIYDTLGTSAPDLALEGTVTQVLTAPLAPVFSLLFITNNQLGLTVTGSAGTSYVVESATNLVNPIWIPVTTNPAPFTFTETNVVIFPQRFYRATRAP